MEREYGVPGATPVRAVRGVHDPDKPGSAIRIETAVRLGMSDIDKRQVTILQRELKWLYENIVLKAERKAALKTQQLGAPVDIPHADGPTTLDAVGPKLEDGIGKVSQEVVQTPKSKPGPKPKQPDTIQSGPKSS